VTLGTADSHGIDIRMNNMGKIKFGGKTISKSDVNVEAPKSELHAAADVLATGDCSDGTKGKGSIVMDAGTKTCNSAPAFTDPVYDLPPAPTRMGVVPSCGAIMTFEEGLYTNRAALNTAMNCPGSPIFDFRPGVYFFSSLTTPTSGTSRRER
jgi:hypothetical protein